MDCPWPDVPSAGNVTPDLADWRGVVIGGEMGSVGGVGVIVGELPQLPGYLRVLGGKIGAEFARCLLGRKLDAKLTGPGLHGFVGVDDHLFRRPRTARFCREWVFVIGERTGWREDGRKDRFCGGHFGPGSF